MSASADSSPAGSKNRRAFFVRSILFSQLRLLFTPAGFNPLKILKRGDFLKKVKCPRCGNEEVFCLTLRYLRLEVTYDAQKGYIAYWDEGEPDIAYCANCHAELEPQDVDYIYSNATIV